MRQLVTAATGRDSRPLFRLPFGDAHDLVITASLTCARPQPHG